jgi:hypothetical protein
LRTTHGLLSYAPHPGLAHFLGTSSLPALAGTAYQCCPGTRDVQECELVVCSLIADVVAALTVCLMTINWADIILTFA